jgi:hypothetical protein
MQQEQCVNQPEIVTQEIVWPFPNPLKRMLIRRCHNSCLYYFDIDSLKVWRLNGVLITAGPNSGGSELLIHQDFIDTTLERLFLFLLQRTRLFHLSHKLHLNIYTNQSICSYCSARSYSRQAYSGKSCITTCQ